MKLLLAYERYFRFKVLCSAKETVWNVFRSKNLVITKVFEVMTIFTENKALDLSGQSLRAFVQNCKFYHSHIGYALFQKISNIGLLGGWLYFQKKP